MRVIADTDRDRAQASLWAASHATSGTFAGDVDIVSGPPSAALTARVERCTGIVVWVPPEWTRSAGPIVAATGHDLGSDAAITPAIELARHGSRAVVLAHVWAMPGLGVVELPPDPWGIGSIPDGQTAALEALAAGVRATAPDVAITAVVRQGPDVARELLSIAGATAAQGLVVGRPHPHGARTPLGAVARELLGLGRCPVVIVPAAAHGTFDPRNAGQTQQKLGL
jgi:nucleotide-binding universal stress UspA family protein